MDLATRFKVKYFIVEAERCSLCSLEGKSAPVFRLALKHTVHPIGDSSKGALVTEVAAVVFHCVVDREMLVLLLVVLVVDTLEGHHFGD